VRRHAGDSAGHPEPPVEEIQRGKRLAGVHTGGQVVALSVLGVGILQGGACGLGGLQGGARQPAGRAPSLGGSGGRQESWAGSAGRQILDGLRGVKMTIWENTENEYTVGGPKEGKEVS